MKYHVLLQSTPSNRFSNETDINGANICISRSSLYEFFFFFFGIFYYCIFRFQTFRFSVLKRNKFLQLFPLSFTQDNKRGEKNII